MRSGIASASEDFELVLVLGSPCRPTWGGGQRDVARALPSEAGPEHRLARAARGAHRRGSCRRVRDPKRSRCDSAHWPLRTLIELLLPASSQSPPAASPCAGFMQFALTRFL